MLGDEGSRPKPFCECAIVGLRTTIYLYYNIFIYLLITHQAAKTRTDTQNLIHCHNLLIEIQHIGGYYSQL